MNRTQHEAAALPRDTELEFDSFFEREAERLFRAMIVVTRDVHAAEDLAQEAFSRVWERWDRVKSMEDPTGYVYRSALNAHFQAHRRAVRAAARFTGSGDPPDPFDSLEDRETLERALLRLPDRQRAALVVTELLGYDSNSAAKIMDIRPGTVRRLVSQAKRRLRSDAQLREGIQDD